jgi:hypothetical protein
MAKDEKPKAVTVNKKYIFKTLRGMPHESFVGVISKKRYKFNHHGLLDGDSVTYEDLKPRIMEGKIIAFEGAVMEELTPEGTRTPEMELKLLILNAKNKGILAFAGKPIEDCTAEEITVALTPVEV